MAMHGNKKKKGMARGGAMAKKKKGMAKGGKLKDVPEGNKGLSKLPPNVRNNMGFKNRGGTISKGNSDYRSTGMFYKGGKV